MYRRNKLEDQMNDRKMRTGGIPTLDLYLSLQKHRFLSKELACKLYLQSLHNQISAIRRAIFEVIWSPDIRRPER